MCVKHKTMAGILITIIIFFFLLCSRLLLWKVPMYLMDLATVARGKWDISLIIPCCWVLIGPIFFIAFQFVQITQNLSRNQFFSLSTAERLTKIAYCFLAMSIIGGLVTVLFLILAVSVFEMEILIFTTLGLFCAYFLCAVASQLVVEAREPRWQEGADSAARFTATKL